MSRIPFKYGKNDFLALGCYRRNPQYSMKLANQFGVQLILFALATVLAGCANLHSVEVTPDAPILPTALVKQVPSAVGLHVSSAVTDGHVEQRLQYLGGELVYDHIIGRALSNSLREALALSYEQVVELDQWPPPATTVTPVPPIVVVVSDAPTIAGAIEEHSTVSMMWQTIEVRLSVHRPDGNVETVLSTGRISTGAHGPIFTSQKALDQQMLRNVAAATMVALRIVPPDSTDHLPLSADTSIPERGVVAVRLDAGLARDDGIEKRVGTCLRSTIPPSSFASAEQPAAELRDALFPWLEPGVAPRSTEDVEKFLAQPQIKRRLLERGVGFLTLFTAHDAPGKETDHMLCGGGLGAGACFGLYERRSGYDVDMSVWNVASGRLAAVTQTEFATKIGAVGVLLPIPYYSTNATDACQQMQSFVRGAIVSH